MFRHGDDVYFVGRTDPDGQYWNKPWFEMILPQRLHQLLDMGRYSLRDHHTALFKLDKENLTLEKILDLPGCGDNSFPSVIRTGKNKFMIANYSSPYPCDWSWIKGQTSKDGTQIYFVQVEFEEN